MKSNEPDFLYYNRGLFRVRRSILRLFGLVLSVAFLFFTTVAIVFMVPEATAQENAQVVFASAVLLTGAVLCLRKSKKPKG